MTLEDFLIWEAGQEEKHEFDGLQPVAMAGGTAAHDVIRGNLGAELNVRLRGKPCRVQGPDLKIVVAGRVRYPDAFVICSPLVNASTFQTDPVVVFEVMSQSTAATDQTIKNAEYRATPSIQRYVILSQESISATVYERAGERWIGTLVADPEAILSMPEIGVELPSAALYDRLAF